MRQQHQRVDGQLLQQQQQQQQQQEQRPYETILLIDREPVRNTVTSSTIANKVDEPKTKHRRTHHRDNADEALQQLHAQSSGDTSGIGSDIVLQRINTLSSTETSGYDGGDLQSPIDLTSPTSTDFHHVHRHQAGRANANQWQRQSQLPQWSANEIGERMQTTASSAVCDGGMDNRIGKSSENHHQQRQRSGGRAPDSTTRSRRDESGYGGDESYRQNDRCYYDQYDQLHHGGTTLLDGSASARQSYNNGSATSAPLQQPMHYSNDAGGSRTGTSRECREGSAAALTTASNEDSPNSGQFLGRNTQSAWLRWSHERRASYKRRVEIAEQRQSEIERYRVSSPVRKARQESARFVNAALEIHPQMLVASGAAIVAGINAGQLNPKRTDVDDADALGGLPMTTCGHPAFPFEIPAPAVAGVITKKPGKKGGSACGMDAEKLTLAQWDALVAFWEHPVFARARFFGILFSFAAVAICVTGVVDNHWTNFGNHSIYGESHSGLWQICSSSGIANCTEVEYTKLHIAVIGQVIFTLAFGLIATVLAIGGLCTSSLPKKVYYYHSAGEIHIICAFSDIMSVILFLSSADLPRQLTNNASLLYDGATIGRGLYLVGGATLFFTFGAFSMCLDDIIRALTKGICRRRRALAENRRRRSTMRQK